MLAETKAKCPLLLQAHHVLPEQLLPAVLLPARHSCLDCSHEPPVHVKSKIASFGKSPPLCTLPAFTKCELKKKSQLSEIKNSLRINSVFLIEEAHTFTDC